MKKTDLITIVCPVDEMITTQWGTITMKEYCERERDRINSHGDNVKVVIEKGEVAISR